MNWAFLQSLRARLILGAAVWIVIGVTAAAIFIGALFRDYAFNQVDGELRGHLQELTTLIDVDADGNPHLYRAGLSDPRFDEVGSGFTWQVSRAGKVLIKSTSASTFDLPIPTDPLVRGQVNKVALDGPNGPMGVFERLYFVEGSSLLPMRIQIGADNAIIDSILPSFDIPLVLSFTLLAIALIVAAGMQVRFGLQPMVRLRRALGAIRSGHATKLPRDFPSEVQPLIDDLNNLIELNAQMVLRARAQAGNLAHALKTPLAVLTDESYRLENRGETQSAAVILQQSSRMQRQIDFHTARARAAASRSVPGVVAAVAPTVSGIVSAMKRLYAGKNLVFVEKIDPDCVAQCDPMDLNEMLANLIDNACKWARGEVIVSAHGEKQPHTVIITIEDDGPGLPPEKMEVVFRIGERLDEQTPGSGLGLPIVRDLAQLYGGDIRLGTAPSGGLRAVLKLPQAS